MDVLIWMMVTIAVVALLLGAVWGLNRLGKRPPVDGRD